MKIVNFRSGLGNQIFFYLFYRYLQCRYPSSKIYGYYRKEHLKKHNGLEIDKVFDIQLPPQTLWSNVITFMARKLNGLGVKYLKSTDYAFFENAVYFDGWWQNKSFFLENIREIKFRNFILDDVNRQLMLKIQNTDAVSLHIRRGDYLDIKNVPIYGDICTVDYYRKAIALVQAKFRNPVFFVFSNDIEWVKKNFSVSNVIYINNNSGLNSYLDMYLMSFCKFNIIANSSFSYWGAMLNHNEDNGVIYPSKWFNTHTPDIFPDKWIGI